MNGEIVMQKEQYDDAYLICTPNVEGTLVQQQQNYSVPTGLYGRLIGILTSTEHAGLPTTPLYIKM